MTSFDLKKKVAFVTGGNGGIGLGMAKGLAAAGATVVIAGRNKTKGASSARGVARAGATAEFVELDVLKEVSCQAAVDAAPGNSAGSTSWSTTPAPRCASSRRI